MVVDSAGNTIVDATIPPGLYNPVQKVGWSQNATGTAFKYKNKGTPVPLVGGIYKIVIKHIASTPGRVKFVVAGKTGNYSVNQANLPVHATIVIEGALGTNGECSDALFTGSPGTCAFSGSSVRCK